jgi:hypothetical protein
MNRYTKRIDFRPRWVANLYSRLVGEGVSEFRAMKLSSRIERAAAEEFHPVEGSKGSRYFLPGAPKTTPTISRTVLITKKYGLSPKKLAAAHKSGERSYKTAASEEQAKKTILTRKFTRRFKRPKGFTKASYEHAFRAVGAIGKLRSHVWFEGAHLIAMQNYREDWQKAVATGDDTFLKRYRAIEIFDVNDRQVFPETDIDKLKAFQASLDASDRTLFDAEVNYIVKAAA